jgi:hypothetical protein
MSSLVKEDDHIKGVMNAPVTLVECGDYECPYTGQAYLSFAAFISCVFEGVIMITDTGIPRWSVYAFLYHFYLCLSVGLGPVMSSLKEL